MSYVSGFLCVFAVVGFFAVVIGVNVLVVRADGHASNKPQTPGSRARAVGQQVVVPQPIEVAHDAAMSALQQLGAHTRGEVRLEQICAYTFTPYVRGGSLITIWLTPVQGGTAIYVETRPNSTMVISDFGQSARHTRALAASIRRSVGDLGYQTA